MAPKRKESPPNGDESSSEGEESQPEGKEIPTGWDVESDIQKDGSRKTTYYCPDTEQHFDTYRRLTRYVDYAKKNRVGAYGLLLKSTKISTSIVPSPSPRKTSATLSLPGRPCQSSSDDDSKSSSTGKSGDVKEDEESVPKKDAAVFTELETDAAVDQNTQERRMSSRPKIANTMLKGFVLSKEKKGRRKKKD